MTISIPPDSARVRRYSLLQKADSIPTTRIPLPQKGRLASSYRYRLPVLICALVGLLAVFGHSAAFGHDVLTTYIHHRERINVGRTNIDVEVELTFYEARSLIERRLMDANHDGVITRAETREYLAGIAGSLEKGLRMTVAGRVINLMPLYDSEIDLLGVDQVAQQHHILRLFYFARTPSWLGPDTEIRLEDSLWASVPSVGAGEVIGSDGIVVASDAGADAVATTPARQRVVLARVVAVPPQAGGQVRNQESVSRNRPTFTALIWAPKQTLIICGIGIIITVIACGVAIKLRPRKKENDHANHKII